MLADAKVGYSWNSSLRGLGYSSMMDLLPLHRLGKGFRLFMYQPFTADGSICRKHRRMWNREEKSAQLPTNGKLLFVKWKDTGEVTICSTIHKKDSGKTVRSVQP